jgi:hypothetical protein
LPDFWGAASQRGFSSTDNFSSPPSTELRIVGNARTTHFINSTCTPSKQLYRLSIPPAVIKNFTALVEVRGRRRKELKRPSHRRSMLVFMNIIMNVIKTSRHSKSRGGVRGSQELEEA